MTSGKIVDLRREHQDAYAPREEPRVFDAGRTWCVDLTGRGDPAGPEFQEAVATLFGLVRRLKRMAQKEGRDFKVMPLECVYWTARKHVDLTVAPPKSWHWRLLVRVPRFITARDLTAACAQLEDRRAAALARAARLEWMTEGLCAQALHVGGYAAEHATIERIRIAAQEQGFTATGPHHEIYLSDPKRIAPERLRTLIRLPVARSSAARVPASASVR